MREGLRDLYLIKSRVSAHGRQKLVLKIRLEQWREHEHAESNARQIQMCVSRERARACARADAYKHVTLTIVKMCGWWYIQDPYSWAAPEHLQQVFALCAPEEAHCQQHSAPDTLPVSATTTRSSACVRKVLVCPFVCVSALVFWFCASARVACAGINLCWDKSVSCVACAGINLCCL
jgi:hypothetical protein